MAKWSINELRNRSGTSNKRRSVALGATGALVGAIVAPALGFNHSNAAPWVFTEDFAPFGGWNQAQYASVVEGTYITPQLYNSHMIALTKSAYKNSSGPYSRPDCSITSTINLSNSTGIP